MLMLVYCLCCVLCFGQMCSGAIALRRRCRSLADLGAIPANQNTSTFHNFGYPLIHTLCKTNDPQLREILGCSIEKQEIWPKTCEQSTKRGPGASTIIVDPHVIAVPEHTASAGVFVVNALYAKLYKLGYAPKVRYWSEELNSMFDSEISDRAMLQSMLWDLHEQTDAPNPYVHLDNYILLQAEVANVFTKTIREVRNISDSRHGRAFQWIIGLHLSSMHPRYTSNTNEAHCIGANHFLGEGLFCSNAGVISCPMFPLHRAASRAVNDTSRATLKENIVLIDGDVFASDISASQLQDALVTLGVHDVQAIVHRGRQRDEVPELYKRTKVTIDCDNGGVEFINYEAALYDVLTLSCSSRATRNAFDYPVPSKYLLEPNQWTQLVQTVYALLINYTQHVPEFRHFKALSRGSDERALTQLDVHFFSRDVIFRTHCESFAQCRRTIPWAIAMWILYPLARIEVYTTISEVQYRLDNDLALTALSRTFNAKYFKVSRVQNDVHPYTYFAFAPCTYVVYMHPTVLPFGRDFLNSHMHYMVQHNISKSIAYWEDSNLLVSISTGILYAKFVKIVGVADVYLEHLGTLRRVENYELYAHLRACGVWEYRTVPVEYLLTRTVGAVLTMGEYNSTYLSMNVSNTVQPTVPLVMDMLVTPEDWIDTDAEDTAVTTGTKADEYVDTDSCMDTPFTSNTAGGSGKHTQQPMPIIRVPYIWLTSSTPRITVSTLLSLTQSTVEQIVQHLDPVIQNSLMQKIMPFIPQDVAQVLSLFDAVKFPNVVSLLDSRHQNWVDNCAN